MLPQAGTTDSLHIPVVMITALGEPAENYAGWKPAQTIF